MGGHDQYHLLRIYYLSNKIDIIPILQMGKLKEVE